MCYSSYFYLKFLVILTTFFPSSVCLTSFLCFIPLCYFCISLIRQLLAWQACSLTHWLFLLVSHCPEWTGPTLRGSTGRPFKDCWWQPNELLSLYYVMSIKKNAGMLIKQILSSLNVTLELFLKVWNKASRKSSPKKADSQFVGGLLSRWNGSSHLLPIDQKIFSCLQENWLQTLLSSCQTQTHQNCL